MGEARHQHRGRLSRCAMCDEWYYENDAEARRRHDHWHPQSGPLRDRWLASRLPWDEFILVDDEAAEWDKRRRP